MSESAPLDPAAIERLLRLGGKEFVAKMLDLFLSYTAEKIAEARAAQKAGDLKGLAKAVHPIKSSAGNVGARKVQNLALRLETDSNKGRGGEADKLLTELEMSFAEIKPLLEEKRRSLLGGGS